MQTKKVKRSRKETKRVLPLRLGHKLDNMSGTSKEKGNRGERNAQLCPILLIGQVGLVLEMLGNGKESGHYRTLQQETIRLELLHILGIF